MGHSKPSGMTKAEALAYIKSHITRRGGYNINTLARFGVGWPPPRGWKVELAERLTGQPHPRRDNPLWPTPPTRGVTTKMTQAEIIDQLVAG